MKTSIVLRFGLAAAAVALLSTAVFAQKVETHPYAGGFFPVEWAGTASFRNEGLYGVRGGYFFTDKLIGRWFAHEKLLSAATK